MAKKEAEVHGIRIKETRADRTFNVLNLIFWILVLFITLYPLWLVLIASVSDPDAVLAGEVLFWPKGFSLMGYEAVFQHSELWQSYLNSIIYTVLGSALSVIVSLAAAYALSRKFAGKAFVNFLITFTMFFSGGLIPIFLNVRDLGLYDTRLVMILMNTVSVWNLMVARTYIQSSIPNELYEAAVMDGADHFTYFFRCVLPLSGTIIAGTKALIAAIAAGGWIAVLVIIVICLIGMLLGSVFGIFFSGEDSGTGMSMQTVVQEINTEYNTKLQEEKSSVSYDVLEMSGSRAVWKEVLAVYSVKVNTDPDNPQEVATMDESKKQLLTDIFWEMNEISSSTDTKTETVITETDDGHGNIVETESTVTQTYLYITVSHKTADEMAAQYGFNEEQKEYLAELLADENNSLWSQVLYGITGTDDQIVTVALSQIGTMGGDPYWSWYGFNSRVEWCACFVSWCANECGYIDAGVIPKYAGCVNGVQWFKDRGQWLDNSAEPTPGMIIFFDWADESGQDGLSDHTGIVQKVENGRVYTVEGNSGDSVRQNSYPVGYYEILGYGAPAY